RLAPLVDGALRSLRAAAVDVRLVAVLHAVVRRGRAARRPLADAARAIVAGVAVFAVGALRGIRTAAIHVALVAVPRSVGSLAGIAAHRVRAARFSVPLGRVARACRNGEDEESPEKQWSRNISA